jgi:hypothetical protein
MAAHHPESPSSAVPHAEGWTPFNDEQSESEEDALDLWSLPRDAVAPPATDTLLAAWAGVQGHDGNPPPGDEQSPDSSAISPPDASARHRARSARPGVTRTVLVSTIVSAVVGLATLPIIGLLAADIRIAKPDRSPTSTTTTDDRVVVPGPSGGCLTMLVKPRKPGTTANLTGTCFAVG